MAKTTQQKEAALLWQAEQQEAEAIASSRALARYLQKWLRDIGKTGDEVADAKLAEIRRLAQEVHDLLEEDTE